MIAEQAAAASAAAAAIGGEAVLVGTEPTERELPDALSDELTSAADAAEAIDEALLATSPLPSSPLDMELDLEDPKVITALEQALNIKASQLNADQATPPAEQD
jgi:hypothetical protein